MTKNVVTRFFRHQWGAVLVCVLPFTLALAQELDPSSVVPYEPDSSVKSASPPGEDTLLCNEKYPECIWIRQEVAPASDPPVDPFVDAEGDKEEGAMILEWRLVPAFGSPAQKVGDCSRTARRLLDKATADFAGANPNRVLENIDWNGMTSQTADPLIDRVLALMGPGQWQHQEVVASYGEMDPKQVRSARRTLRWVLPGSTQTFQVRERLGCWLLSPSA